MRPAMSTYAALFPGLGSRRLRLPAGIWPLIEPDADLWEEADDAAARLGQPPPSTTLRQWHAAGSASPLVRSPDHDIVLFTVTVALYRRVTLLGRPPDLLIGYSFGYHTALVCAGVFSVTDAIRMLLARTTILGECASGVSGTTMIEAGPDAAMDLVAATSHPSLVVACLNTPSRTTVSGLLGPLTAFESLAASAGIAVVRLPLSHAFHSPLMRPAVGPLRLAVDGMRQRKLQADVYSTVTGRLCRDDDDLLSDMVESIAVPVRFLDALYFADRRRIGMFVEFAVTETLSSMVADTLPHAASRACMTPRDDPRAALADLITNLRT